MQKHSYLGVYFRYHLANLEGNPSDFHKDLMVIIRSERVLSFAAIAYLFHTTLLARHSSSLKLVVYASHK